MHSNELLWESNFENLDTLLKEWNIIEYPPRKVNNELQRYTPDSFKFQNEELLITTIKHGNDIKSGRVTTKDKIEVQYGYIEALIKFDTSKGIWPAFWMLGNQHGWPHCGEIDIMEFVGWNKDALYGTLHGPGYCGGNPYGSGGVHVLKNNTDWHKYAIEWEPDIIKWYLDDNIFFTATRDGLNQKHRGCHWVYNDRPFYFLLNTAVGGCFGGAFHDSERFIHKYFPFYNEYRIKYIKVFKTKNGHGNVIKKV